MASIYIVYNADSTPMGKIKYACTKIMSSASDSPCSACDLTHGGLNLNETAKWAATKKRIGGAEIQQLHRDELNAELKHYIDLEKLQLPVVIGQHSKEGALKILMEKGELALCSKNHESFLTSLQKNSSEQGLALEFKA